MSKFYPMIIDAYLKGEAPKASWVNRTCVTGNGPWGGGAATHGMSAMIGTPRLAVNGAHLTSFAHYSLAVRLSDGLILLNGDRAPTATTATQQRDLFRQIEATKVRHAYVPLSALRPARIYDAVRIVVRAMTPATYVKVNRPCASKTWCKEPKPHTHDVEHHFLGETLFEYAGRLFLCGLDRNDIGTRPHFYLCELPADAFRKVRTVEAAIEALRPRGVPAGVPRQGEWFFVPADKAPKDGVEFHKLRVAENYVHNNNLGVRQRSRLRARRRAR